MLTMHPLSGNFPQCRLLYPMFSGNESDGRASFGLSVRFGVCSFGSEIPVGPVRLRSSDDIFDEFIDPCIERASESGCMPPGILKKFFIASHRNVSHNGHGSTNTNLRSIFPLK